MLAHGSICRARSSAVVLLPLLLLLLLLAVMGVESLRHPISYAAGRHSSKGNLLQYDGASCIFMRQHELMLEVLLSCCRRSCRPAALLLVLGPKVHHLQQNLPRHRRQPAPLFSACAVAAATAAAAAAAARAATICTLRDRHVAVVDVGTQPRRLSCCCCCCCCCSRPSPSPVMGAAND